MDLVLWINLLRYVLSLNGVDGADSQENVVQQVTNLLVSDIIAQVRLNIMPDKFKVYS